MSSCQNSNSVKSCKTAKSKIQQYSMPTFEVLSPATWAVQFYNVYYFVLLFGRNPNKEVIHGQSKNINCNGGEKGTHIFNI